VRTVRFRASSRGRIRSTIRRKRYFVSREPVEPVEIVELDDLIGRHADAGIELRIVPELWPLWQRVIGSTLEFSGIRLRNLKP
jgi:hypothetical protein